MSVNVVMILGHLGQAPELTRNNDKSICKFTLATNKVWKDKGGNRKEETEWHNVVFFGRGAEVIANFATKGSKLWVQGSLKTNKWTDKKSGAIKYTTQVVGDRFEFEGGKAQGGEPNTEPPLGFQNKAESETLSEDDIPF